MFANSAYCNSSNTLGGSESKIVIGHEAKCRVFIGGARIRNIREVSYSMLRESFLHIFPWPIM